MEDDVERTGISRGFQAGTVREDDELRMDGDQLGFTVTALHQTVNGRIEIEESLVRVELRLPLLLRIFSTGTIGGIRAGGSLLLNGPPKR